MYEVKDFAVEYVAFIYLFIYGYYVVLSFYTK